MCRARDLSLRCWDSSGEVSKLVQLVEVLGTLQENLLVVSQVFIGVQILISENSNVFLEIPYLIVEVNELLSLLLK